MNTIRFPPSAKLGSTDMATRVSWIRRKWWKWFGHRRKANVAKVRLDKARRFS